MIQRNGILVVLMLCLTLTSACGIARVGNATVGEIGVGGSLTSSPAGLRGEGAATDATTGAELGGVAVWVNFPAVLTAGMRWLTSQTEALLGPTPTPAAEPASL